MLHEYQTNFFAHKFFSTSTLLQQLWDQLVSKRHDAMLTMLSPRLDPFSTQAFDLVEDVRRTLRDLTEASEGPDAAVPGLQFFVFSYTSAMLDTIELTQLRLPISLFICIFISFTLIATAFGAALIPVKMLFTVFLPITWTYGAALFVYEDGWLAWTRVPGLQPVGTAGIHWSVFMLTPCVVLGLALDYDIFLFTRVWEFRSEGFGDRESVQLGLSATGPIITQAGLIFTFTFSMMVMGSVPTANQMGFIWVFNILIDTFVVRTILVPSMLGLRPGLNYWPTVMPEVEYQWLDLPRGAGIIRRLDVSEDLSDTETLLPRPRSKNSRVSRELSSRTLSARIFSTSSENSP